MRKLSIVLSIMVVATILGACAGNVSSTKVPANTPIATDGFSTPSVESQATATAAPAEAVPTETKGATAVVPVTGNPNASRLSEQLDFTVLNQNGEQIGEVDDMILNLDNAMVAYVIVSTGEKQIVVPWDQLSMQSDQPSAFVLQVDDDTFTNAPAVDLSTLPAIGEPANDWDAQLRDYWKGNNAGGAQPAPGSANQNKLRGLMLASQVLAANLSVPNQTALQAEIEDLIVNLKSGKIQFVVVKTNLDNTERWLPIPLALFSWDNALQGFNMNLDMSVLEAVVPALEAQFPDTTVEGWEQEWIDFWQSQGVNLTP